jgi:signal transduction histidine kinase
MTTTNAHTILIVDNDSGMYDFIQFQLEKQNVHFVFSQNGRDAIKTAVEIVPDLILLDVMIPGMDGFEICRRMRAISSLAEVPILIITSLDDPDSRLKGFLAGADDFFTKPVEQIVLVSRIQNILRMNRYRKQDEARAELAENLLANNQKLIEVSQHLIEIQEKERRFLASELHDDLGSLLTGLKFMIEMAGTQSGEDLQKTLDQCKSTVADISLRVRKLSLDLRPAMLDDFGLFAALEWLFERYSGQTNVQVKHNIDFTNHSRFPKQVETAAFRIIQESLTNAAKYADSKSVNVDVKVNDKLKIVISDHGKGFDLAEFGSKYHQTTGISSMRERVNLLGGEFSIVSKPGSGTVIKAIFKLDEVVSIVQN